MYIPMHTTLCTAGKLVRFGSETSPYVKKVRVEEISHHLWIDHVNVPNSALLYVFTTSIYIYLYYMYSFSFRLRIRWQKIQH
jgi:hypothetical protein